MRADVFCGVLLFLTFSALVANPKKTTLHGGQSRSWSAEQGKKEKEKVWQRPPPPPPLRAARSEKNKNNKIKKLENHAAHPQCMCVWVCSIEHRLDFFVISAGGSCHLGVLVWVCSSSCKDHARGSAGSKTPGVATICGWSAAGRRYSADRGVWCVYGLEHKEVEW